MIPAARQINVSIGVNVPDVAVMTAEEANLGPSSRAPVRGLRADAGMPPPQARLRPTGSTEAMR